MCIRIVEPSSANEAIEMLWAGHELWRGHPWVFRGEGDSSWKLLPSAYREDALLFSGARMERGRMKHIQAQIDAEWRTLRRFLVEVDRSGLVFANPDPAFVDVRLLKEKYDSVGKDISVGDVHKWPLPEVLSNLGLAQHYGIHTRLLDWTTSLQVAGYFASAGASKRAAGSSGSFTVWGLRKDFLDHAANKELLFAKIVRVQRASNPNLHAQEGLFIDYRSYGSAKSTSDAFAPEPFDAVVTYSWNKLKASDGGSELKAYAPPLVRLDVPVAFAGEVARRLAEMGWGPGRCFPGYDGAARALKEQEFWAR